MVDGFPFHGPLWFIGPKPPYKTAGELCRVVLHGSFEDATSGNLVPVVYAFSADERAAEFLKEGGSQSAHYEPLKLPSDEKLIEFLTELEGDGHKYLLIDPRGASGILSPIFAIIDEIRKRIEAEAADDPG
jgi:hypothetical protein